MDANTGVAAPYLPNPAGRNMHAPGPAHAGIDYGPILSQFAGLALGGMGMPSSSSALPMGPGHFMAGPDGQFVLAPMPATQPMGMGPSQDNLYSNFAMPAGSYGAPYVGLPMSLMPYTPGRPSSVHPRPDRGDSNVPGLENRRGSYSTIESTSATPFYGTASQRDGGPRVASLDRSAYTTPSLQQLGLSALQTDPAKAATTALSDRAVDDLLKEPVIPRAVPAVFTPPDDRLLFDYASRFGSVETSKAIIDTNTGACKGFGLAKFCDVHDSGLCIRGFHRLGYEVGFARESFNSRLKAEGDEASTNLYISNLSKSLTEMELATIFLGYTILSSKILRDSMGNSRGVGFARFDSREICDEIIRKFNGVNIGEEGLLMDIRYADTPAQKELKRVTAERRQFRTNEYNIGAYGTPLVGMSPTLYGKQAQWRRALPISRSGVSASSNEESNVMRNSETRRGLSETATSASTDAAVSTPNSSECDEGVTIHAESTVVAVIDEGVQSSLSAKRWASMEATKKDAQ